MNDFWTTRFESFDNVKERLDANEEGAWEVARELASDSLQRLRGNVDRSLHWVQAASEQFSTAVVHASKQNLAGFSDAIDRARVLIP